MVIHHFLLSFLSQTQGPKLHLKNGNWINVSFLETMKTLNIFQKYFDNNLLFIRIDLS